MKLALDAIFEKGAFRPIRHDPLHIAEGKQVRLIVEEKTELEALRLAASVYEGLTPEEIDEIERIALDRSNFVRPTNPD